MDIPKLVIKYPEPDDPEYGTAPTPYDLAALKAWAGQVTEYLKEVEPRLRPALVSGFEPPVTPEAPRPPRSRGARPAPPDGDNDADS